MKLPRALACSACAIAIASMMELVGCGDSTSATGGGGNGGTGGGQASARFENSACGACVIDACADAVSTCRATAECSGYLDCLLACPLDDFGNVQAACDDGCAPASESSEALAGRVAVHGCRQTGAGAACDACGVGSTSGQECMPVPQETPCLQCYSAKCCETREACQGSSVDCQALFDCTIPCGDVEQTEPCLADCLAAHPESIGAFVAERQCALIVCANEQDSCDAADRDECETCLYGTCSLPLNDLLATPDGYLTFWCSEDCAAAQAGGDCYAACTDEHPAQKEAFLLWAECVNYWCPGQCLE